MPNTLNIELSKQDVLRLFTKEALDRIGPQDPNISKVQIAIAGPDGSIVSYMEPWHSVVLKPAANDPEYWDRLGARVQFTLQEPPKDEKDVLRTAGEDGGDCEQGAREPGEESPGDL